MKTNHATSAGTATLITETVSGVSFFKIIQLMSKTTLTTLSVSTMGTDGMCTKVTTMGKFS
jgi:hypothetical protein